MKKIIYFILLSLIPFFIEAKKNIKQKNTIKKEMRTITIKNNIKDEALVYNSFWGKFSPSEFSVFINDEEIKKEKSKNIKIKDDIITIKYNYAFGSYRKGSKSITFSIPKEEKELDLTFSWNKKSRISINKTKITNTKKITKKNKIKVLSIK